MAFVLPNLHLDPEEASDPRESSINLGLGEIAIVSPRDERVQAFVQRFPEAGSLLKSFRDEQGRPVEPATLIVREETALQMKRQMSPLVSFRNAAAVSHLLLGRARAINDNAWSVVVWSDTFDFHPASISLTGTITVISPAVMSFALDAEKYNATPSPGIPEAGPRLFGDGYLARALGSEWKRRFLNRRREDSFGRVLFRSLELAYIAAATPLKNQASLHDLGTLVALWVNALEILAHPGKGKQVQQTNVVDLLGAYQWEEPRLQQPRYKLKIGRKVKRQGNAIQRAVNYMYAARNRFLHGEPVGESVLRPVLGKQRVVLLRVASLVYRAALEGYLIRRYPRASILSDAPDSSFELFMRNEYDQALLRLMGYKDNVEHSR